MANHSGTHRDVCRLVPLFISVVSLFHQQARKGLLEIFEKHSARLAQKVIKLAPPLKTSSSVLGPGAKCRTRNNEWKISEFEPGVIVSQPLALMVLLTET